MQEILCSVIIPCYNNTRFLNDCLRSVVQQTCKRWEAIVVDDGSVNDREVSAVVSSFDDPRFKLERLERNRGLAASRNAGIRLAQGKYIQFLDADDLLHPEKIQKQIDQLERTNQPSVSGCDFRFFDDEDSAAPYGGDVFRGTFPLHEPARLFEFQTVIHRWLFPASLLSEVGGFEEGLSATEDWLLLWKIAAKGTQFLYLDEALASYRKHGQAMTCDAERIAKGHLLAIDCVEKYQKEHGITFYSRRDLNGLRESYHYELALSFVRSNRIVGAWYELMKAFVLSSNRRQVKLLLMAATPALRTRTIDWVKSADDRLWRWRAQLRKTFVG